MPQAQAACHGTSQQILFGTCNMCILAAQRGLSSTDRRLLIRDVPNSHTLVAGCLQFLSTLDEDNSAVQAGREELFLVLSIT
jgi:hypothetical protein